MQTWLEKEKEDLTVKALHIVGWHWYAFGIKKMQVWDAHSAPSAKFLHVPNKYIALA